ncbi:MAG: YceD family protein [Aristaeellaceae bacterium]
MKLNATLALKNPGQEYPFEGEQTIAPQEISGDTITFDPAQLKGVYSATEGGSVTVTGSLVTTAHGSCAKCLEPASVQIEAEFQETFQRDGDPEDDEIFAYEGYILDFEKLAMSYALFNLPMRMLCREDCPGLLVSPDDDVCLCQKEAHTQRPFAALQQLLTEKSNTNEQ